MTIRPTAVITALVAATIQAVACASGPNPAVIDARQAYQNAAADPLIASRAALPLRDAEQAVGEAERADRKGEDRKEVDHLAYVASRRVEIARAVAAKRLAQEQTQQLAERKDSVLLQERTREADILARDLRELQARESERGLVVTVSDVFFDVDRADLKPGALGPLSVLAAFLSEHPERVVEVEGHTDSTGTPAYNMDLSRARAEAVRTALIRDGVDPSRIEARGFGETAPIASNRTAAGRLQNRRVEIIVPTVSLRTGSMR